MKSSKITIKEKLLREGYFLNEKDISAWIMMRRVFSDNELILSPATKVKTDSAIYIKKYYDNFSSKGGLKLQGALDFFNISPLDKVCFDCGASTGGFTDCLMKNGSKLVYAVDAGHDQLLASLKNNSNVINLENTNISDSKLLTLNPKPTFATLDLSYLSLKKALPILEKIIGEKSYIVALVKPIFEVDSKNIRKSGDINHHDIFMEVLNNLYVFIENETSFSLLGITNSTIRGNSGTIEFFMLLTNDYENKGISKNIIDGQIVSAISKGMKLPDFKS